MEPSAPRSSLPWSLRRRSRRLADRTVEFLLLGVASAVLLAGVLILVFVGREAWPIVTGSLDAALVKESRPVAEVLRLAPDELRAYLELTPREFNRLDTAALRELAILRFESQSNLPPVVLTDPDARANPVAWRYLLLPHAWKGYDSPAFVWQPISLIRKYNLIPLLVGSLKIALLALAVAVPLGFAAALHVSQFAPGRWRPWLKSGLELIAGIPSVVIGFLAVALLATLLEVPVRWLAEASGLTRARHNALLAGLALGFALVPLVFTLAEDALAAVPRSQIHAALALGSTPWQAATRVVVPAALPGLVAAVILGFGRALGETMIVLLASGNAPILSANPFDPARTAAATIAAEMAEAVFGGPHYRVLFLVGTLLFLVTFALNLLADVIMQRFTRATRHPA